MSKKHTTGRTGLLPTLRIILALSPVIFILLLFPGIAISNYILSKRGVCTKGIVINKRTSDRTGPSMFYYKVVINNTAYTGNSQETNPAKVGDSVCIVYLKAIPYINRAVKYFDPGKTPCDCGQ